jgi:hypothetical protein
MIRARLAVAAALVAAVTAALVGVAPAGAAVGTPWWLVGVSSRPSSLPGPGDEGELALTVENVGDATASAGMRVATVLPSGLRLVGIAGSAPVHGGKLGETVALSCSSGEAACVTTGPVAPFDAVEVRLRVEVLSGAHSGEQVGVQVSGGGGAAQSVSRAISVGGASGFGVEAFALSVEGEGGGVVTQAGSHPYQVTGSIMLDQGADSAPVESPPTVSAAGGAVRDVVARLPPGLIADPGVSSQRCLSWQFSTGVPGYGQDECPYESAVGVASVTFDDPGLGVLTLPSPVFNVEPEAGEPARFGFYVPIEDVPVNLTTSVRSGTGEDWGVDLQSLQIPQGAGILSVRVTFWGVPNRSTHDQARGWGCLAEARGGEPYEKCVHVEEPAPAAFVTLPTICTGNPLSASVEVDSWAQPGVFDSLSSEQSIAALSGCERVAFTPTISTSTTTASASSPSGFALNLNFDTEGLTSGTGIAQSNLKDTVVSLPEGLTIDPSAGVGLGACTQTQFDEATVSSASGAGCPDNSKLGTVEIETPLLFTTVYGSLYVATPYANPFSEPGHPNGSLIALYVIARSRAERGILVKLAGKVTPDPTTGRLTVSFENDPPLPFAHFNFHFKEGAQAPLITPATCGTYATSAQLTPYSAPEHVLTDTASFQVTSGSEGAPCPGSVPPFAPAIGAGTLTNHAGTFSPLYFDLSRTDAMQYISSFSTVLPLGLTADLTGVPQCPPADIALARTKTGIAEEQNPSCPQASVIGHSLVGTGVGAILDYVPGTLYLAGPFKGEPLSVVSITSAVVGPFDLGTVVVQFGLHIDPYTAQVSISPSGSEPIPTIIDGIVTHVRDIKVSIDRPNFTINPTACEARLIASGLTSSLGYTATTSTPLHAEACNELAFKPSFKAYTNGKTSRQRGASLSVKLTMPIKLGTQSNIKTVKVDLPKQLPAQLKTLQEACTETQFNANPAGCPPGSIVGHAKAITPILPEPLTGPAIFVSHAGLEFPSLILVLQGYGFEIDIVGSTYVSPKTGTISSTFKTVPDEPVSRFELTLPQGRYPALAANTSLCKLTRVVGVKKRVIRRVKGRRRRVTVRVKKRVRAKLVMPTLFVAQNGGTVKRETPIAVEGCKAKKARHGHKRRKREKASRRRH